jgi:hypothetical protein
VTPNLNEIHCDEVVDGMVAWFFENFEDPAQNLPHEEGDYVRRLSSADGGSGAPDCR